jgi:hypothetical protein
MAGFPKGSARRAVKAKRPHAGCKLDKELVAKLIVEQTGNVSRVADRLGCGRGTISQLVEREPELKALLKQCRERQLDELEQSVFDRAIETRDTTLQLFLLKTQGKSRGYEQSEAQNAAKDIATAAFDFIVNKSKNPAEPNESPSQ